MFNRFWVYVTASQERMETLTVYASLVAIAATAAPVLWVMSF